MFKLTVHFKHEMIGLLPNIYSNFDLSGTLSVLKLFHMSFSMQSMVTNVITTE